MAECILTNRSEFSISSLRRVLIRLFSLSMRLFTLLTLVCVYGEWICVCTLIPNSKALISNENAATTNVLNTTSSFYPLEHCMHVPIFKCLPFDLHPYFSVLICCFKTIKMMRYDVAMKWKNRPIYLGITREVCVYF